MKGFTLIETMVAITILTLAVAGPLFTASRAIVAAQTARDQLTALYLAQEGIEYVRAMRDNEYLAAYQEGGTDVSSRAWGNFLSNEVLGKCRVEEHTSKICTLGSVLEGAPLRSCPSDNCGPLYLTGCTNSPEGPSCTPPNIYTQENLPGSVRTPFTRTIQAADVASNEIKIISTVSWVFHGTPYSVAVSDHLTSWH